MKKRIGTKLYDTDTALCILPEKGLYRAQRKQTYFLFDGTEITPLTYDEAADLITAAGKAEILVNRKSDYAGRSSVSISAAYANRLAEYCRDHGVSQISVLEKLIDSLSE